MRATTRVILNGREVEVLGGKLSYRSLAQLAGHPYVSVTFRSEGELPQILNPGETLFVSEGMIINAYNTSSA